MRVFRRLARTLAKAGIQWVDDRCPSMAAAVAFFSAFSLAPTLVIVVAVAGTFFGPEAVRGQIVGVGFLMVVSLVLDAGVKVLRDAMWPPDAAARLLMALVNQVTAVVLLAVAFAVMFKALPTVRVRWDEVALGGLVAAVLFSLGKNLFGLYLARAGTADAFGAAGSLAVILMWLFYSAAVFLYGVVFARVWSE